MLPVVLFIALNTTGNTPQGVEFGPEQLLARLPVRWVREDSGESENKSGNVGFLLADLPLILSDLEEYDKL